MRVSGKYAKMEVKKSDEWFAFKNVVRVRTSQPMEKVFHGVISSAKGSMMTLCMAIPGQHDSIELDALRRDFLGVQIGERVKVTPSLVGSSIQKITRLHIGVSRMITGGPSISIDDVRKVLGEMTEGVPLMELYPMMLLVKGIPVRLIVRKMSLPDPKMSTHGIIDPEVTLVKVIDEGLTLSSKRYQTVNLSMLEEGCLEKVGIGGLPKGTADILKRALISRTMDPEKVKSLGIRHCRGILLYGPPGTGKTLIARRLGQLLGCLSVRVVNGPELTNKYIGETERMIRELFQVPVSTQNGGLHMVILDEMDAMFKPRGSGLSSHYADSWVNQMLSKMDGVESCDNIIFIGLTNRKELIDGALLRAGRFGVHIEVSEPSPQGREEIFKIHTARLKDHLSPNVNLHELSSDRLSGGFTGADIEAIVGDALMKAMIRDGDNMMITQEDMIDSCIEKMLSRL
mgnify:FL=1